MQSLHGWLVAQAGDLQLFWLDDSDRFGPLALVSWKTQKPVRVNMSLREAEEWLDNCRGSKSVPAREHLRSEHRKWMTERKLRAASLPPVTGSCSDTGACGQ